MFDDYHHCFRLIDGFAIAELNENVAHSDCSFLKDDDVWRQGQDALDTEVCEPRLTFSVCCLVTQCVAFIGCFANVYVHSEAMTYKTEQSGTEMEPDVLKECGPLLTALYVWSDN